MNQLTTTLFLTQHDLRMVEIVLHLCIKPAHVDPVHEGMMGLHFQWHFHAPVFFEELTPGEIAAQNRPGLSALGA